MSTSASALSVFPYIDHGHCISTCGAAVLSFSLEPPNPRFLEAWAKTMERVVDESNGPVVVVIIIDSNSRSPDDASKKAIGKTVSRYSTKIGAFAYVIEGHDFAAAAVRSAVSLIGLVVRYPFPPRVFKRTDEAAEWALRQLTAASARGLDVPAIVARSEAMRADAGRWSCRPVRALRSPHTRFRSPPHANLSPTCRPDQAISNDLNPPWRPLMNRPKVRKLA